ncbi:MAG TPA: serine hydrolase domain-containing protein [Candidatus Polarisedimenticolaceae bacterium]|nr:serine hydrolase domain-containing protein [Candidatus Polarisedimenticolaceae bacterium]
MILAAFLSLGLPAAAAPPEIPSTPAGKVFAGYLEAMNSGAKDKLEPFIKAHRPDRPDALDRMLDLRWNTGGLDLYAIESSQPLTIQAVVHEREGNGRYDRATVTVSDGEPAVITSFKLVLIPPPAGAPVPGRLTQQAAVAAWKAEIDEAASDGKFSGVWLWARKGKVITSGAAGKADRERGIDNTLDTRFRIGSMNKMFTAVATLQLVERGKLSLDDTIGKILPDYPNAGVASKVKVRHLLSHTGGTGDIFGPEFDAHRLELKTLQDYVKLYGARDLEFEPGTRWDYSNYGFLLLGVMIEKVTGKSYYDYVAENIYKPAGMTHSGSEPESVKVANRSKGYMRDRYDMVGNEPTLPWRGTSAGGGTTTAADLMKFADALMSNKLLKAATLAEATRPQFTTGDYGYGFQLWRSDDARTYGHGGGAPGMNAILRVYPESGQSVIVLCNLDGPSASRIGDWLDARIPLE